MGESFELSNLKDFKTLIRPKEKESLLGNFDLSYLVKYIETREHLSVQVHPDDELARKLENEKGKTECWYILESKPGAGIYLGLKPNVDKNTLNEGIKSNVDVSQFLNFIPVKGGDFFFVPAGTVHAIGKDLLLLEVQQSSGITYRLWDWNRVDKDGKPRSLHVDKGMMAVNDSADFNRSLIEKKIEQVFSTPLSNSSSYLSKVLATHQDFKVEALLIQAESKITIHHTSSRLNSFFVIEGEGTIEGKPYDHGDSLVLLDKKDHLTIKPSKRTHLLWVS